MRLQKVLNEAAELQIVIKDIESKMHELYRILKKHGFQMTDEQLEKTLDSIFKDKGINFYIGKKRGAHYTPLIDGAAIHPDLDIEVELVPGFSQFFRRFAKEGKFQQFFNVGKNQFFYSLAEILSHEYRHLFQTLKSKGKMFKTATNPEYVGYSEYKKTPAELDAFALQAAIQHIRTGKSIVVKEYAQMFSKDDPKVWQKFLKKADAQVKKIKKRGLDKLIKVVQ